MDLLVLLMYQDAQHTRINNIHAPFPLYKGKGAGVGNCNIFHQTSVKTPY